MNITVIGGGNVGTQLAVHCAASGHNVIIYTSKPQLFSKHLKITDRIGNTLLSAEIQGAVNDLSAAMRSADMVIVTLPAFCMDDIAQKMEKYIRKGMIILLVPGTGGSEFAFDRCRNKGAVICGLQRVPSVARLAEYGRNVCAEGYRSCLYLASLSAEKTDEVCRIIQNILSIECRPLPDYLNLTLTPSNPVLHTSRLRTIFKDCMKKDGYSSLPLFYEEWSDESSELLFKMDDEVQQICQKLQKFDLSYVRSLKEHYESKTPGELTKKIRSISGFKGLPTPSVEHDGLFFPDFSSRYFTADFPYGLAVLIQIAELYNIEIPNMKSTMEWYYEAAGRKKEFRLQQYNINSVSDLEHFYDKF